MQAYEAGFKAALIALGDLLTHLLKNYNMGELSNQLKNYFETTSKEQQEKDFFEICCKIEGIDSTLPNAKKLLKRKQMKDKFLYRIFPKIIIILLALVSIVCFIATGYLIGKHNLGTGLCMMIGMFSFTQFLKKICNFKI